MKLNKYDLTSSNPVADLLEDPDAIAIKEATGKKPRKGTTSSRVLRCMHCKSFVKIDKRTKNYYGLQENPICDICAVQIEQFTDDDFAGSYLDRELEIELELLKNPSGRSMPKIYED